MPQAWVSVESTAEWQVPLYGLKFEENERFSYESEWLLCETRNCS